MYLLTPKVLLFEEVVFQQVIYALKVLTVTTLYSIYRLFTKEDKEVNSVVTKIFNIISSL